MAVETMEMETEMETAATSLRTLAMDQTPTKSSGEKTNGPDPTASLMTFFVTVSN